MRLFLLITVVMIAFAANSLLNRAALASGAIGPSSFAAVRLVSGAFCLALLLRARSGGFSLPRFQPYGMLSLSLYVLGFSFAYVTLPAGLGALILFGGVQITMFAGSVMLRETIPLPAGSEQGLHLAVCAGCFGQAQKAPFIRAARF